MCASGFSLGSVRASLYVASLCVCASGFSLGSVRASLYVASLCVYASGVSLGSVCAGLCVASLCALAYCLDGTRWGVQVSSCVRLSTLGMRKQSTDAASAATAPVYILSGSPLHYMYNRLLLPLAFSGFPLQYL